MNQWLEPAQQVTDLRLQFFPVLPFASADAPDRTRLIEKPTAVGTEILNRVPLLVQCNCACK